MAEVWLERHSTIPTKKQYGSDKFIAGIRLFTEDFDEDITPEEMYVKATEVLHTQFKADLEDHENAGVAADPHGLRSTIESL